MRIPHSPPPLEDLLKAAMHDNRLVTILTGLPSSLLEPKYYHWDELRFRKPPEGLTHAQWWTALKLQRLTARREVPTSSLP